MLTGACDFQALVLQRLDPNAVNFIKRVNHNAPDQKLRTTYMTTQPVVVEYRAPPGALLREQRRSGQIAAQS